MNRRFWITNSCSGFAMLCLLASGCGAPEDGDMDPGPEPAQTNVPSGGVCGFTAAVPLAPADSEGFIEVPPNHPSIYYYGRVDCSNPTAPAFAYSAVTVRVRFVGDGLQLRLHDYGKGGAQGTNYYDVLVDGGSPTVLQVDPMTQVYPLATNLAPGEHTVELVKRTESGGGSGKAELLGFRLHGSGAELRAVKTRTHRIEFIGDSITCGYGNEVSTMQPDKAPFTTKNENARLAYGAVAARTLNAEYMAVAYSGRGMYRNYAGQVAPPLPELYLRSMPDDERAAAWLPATAVPEILVINLGTNDFSPGGVDRSKYRAAYVEFVTRLRGYYPKTLFVLAAGPMLSDFYPVGEKAWTSIRDDIRQVVEARNAAGDNNLKTIFFDPQSGPWGEDYHPTVATHQLMADELVPFLKTQAGW